MPAVARPASRRRLSRSLRELARTRPDLKLVYAADDAAFPYGRLDDRALVGRVALVMQRLVAKFSSDL